MKLMKKAFSFVLFFGVLAGILVGYNSYASNDFSGLEDFEDVNLGVVTGSVYDEHSKAFFPNGTLYVEYSVPLIFPQKHLTKQKF